MIVLQKNKCSFLWIIWLFAIPLIAQSDIRVERITTADGLSQGAIFDILQDAEGFMWFGTKDGLNRYDGYEFKVFTNDPDDPHSIAGNQVIKLFEDSNGRIWASVDDHGISIYVKSTGQFHNIVYDPANPAGLSGSNIMQVVEDTSGYFLLNVDEKEINLMKLQDDFFINNFAPQVIRIQMPASLPRDNLVTSYLKGIAKDRKNRIWVGVSEAIYELDVQKGALKFAIDGYSIGASCLAENASIYAGGHNYPLFHWNGEKAITVDANFNAIKEIHVDKKNNVWMIRADSIRGIKILEPSDLIRYENILSWTPPELQNTNFPFGSMEFDRSGMMWVGTNGYGLYKINPSQWSFNHTFHGISVRNIASIANDQYYVNTYSGWYTDDSIYRQFDPFLSETNGHGVSDILYSKFGYYWIKETSAAHNHYSLIQYDPTNEEIRSVEIPWHHYDEQPMIEAKDGSVWMAGFNQILTHILPNKLDIYSYELENGKLIDIDNEAEKLVSRQYSTALFEDTREVIWVGTEIGIFKCSRSDSPGKDLIVQHIKNMPGDENSLSYNHVMCFLDDPKQPDEYLWVGTKGGGLNCMNKKSGQFHRINSENGLPNDVVYGILDDSQGRIWGSTNNGIFCLQEWNIESGTYRVRNFSKNDGLQEEEFNTGAYAKMPDGRLAFGGVNGLNIFDPDGVLTQDFMPLVHITKILVDNQVVIPGDETKMLSQTIEKTSEIILKPKHGILTLEFASLDFTAQRKNKYRYQLIGTDDTWVEAGNQRSATFLHLQAKDYTFRVQGSNSQGVWSNHIAELNIKVLPPWWNTWLAYFIYAILFAAAIFMYMRFSINRAKLNQQLSFEKREADRIRELDVQKTQLYMNMTHEFRTPLTIILGMAKQLKEKPNGQLDSGVNMIIRNGQNLLGLVNKMLSLSKLESGKMKLDLIQDDVILFLKNLSHSFHSLVEQKEIQLHFLPEIDSLVTTYDPDKLQQIISNLISNAYKFTPEDGNIYLIVKVENDSLIIRVKDTGKGISESELQNVFDRFYQGDNTSTRQFDGTGIGLALTKELVTLMGGKISAQSPPTGVSKGTEFFISLPLMSEFGVQVNANNRVRVLDKAQLTKIPQILNANDSITEKQVDKQKGSKRNKLLQDKTFDQNQPLILLVEDNADVVAYVASCIRNEGSEDQKISSGYRLAVAENGQEGLELAIELIPDLIISDVMMPIMDGFELSRQLKTDARTNHIPIVILTARADLNSKLEGLEIGANAYLPKPFEKQELILTIKNLFALRNSLRNKFQNTFKDLEILNVDSSFNQEEVENQVEDAFVRKVREIIEVNIADFNFGVGQISEELHLSHSQLARKLDALTGYSPNRFIRLIKLNKAKELLKDDANSITVIAYDSGFSDPSYFSRVFKKEFGKTPGDWREG